MPDETTTGGDPQNGQQSNDSQYNPSDLDEARKIINALEKRVGERDAELGDLKGRVSTLSEQMQAMQDAQKKRLEQSGNFEELARTRQAEIEALSPYKDRAAALEAQIRTENEKRIERIPEQMRGVIPTDYPPEKLSQWLTNNTALLTKPPAPDYDAGAGGDAPPQKGKLTPAQKQLAARFGLTEEQYLAELEKNQ